MTVRLPGLAALSATVSAILVQGRPTAEDPVSDGVVTAPMQGTVIKVAVENGQHVEMGNVLIVVEAMKMENAVTAPKAGSISGLRVVVGDSTAQGAVLLELT